MKSIIFISFDIRKDDYPAMNFSIASLIASLKNKKIKVSHYSFDLKIALYEKESDETITKSVNEQMEQNLTYFKSFDYIAASLTSWTVEYCYLLLKKLEDFQGKVILGGYEVTSMSRNLLFYLFPRADYFIKGYAEKALQQILFSKKKPVDKIVFSRIHPFVLKSPYLKGVINIYSKKIYWETKRGCKYKCGFCEWGNAAKNVTDISILRLLREMKLFKKCAVDEINILDGTFNSGYRSFVILSKLLRMTNAKITFQARFEDLISENGNLFIQTCNENKDRIRMEFGLQTIHKEEMKVIGRGNDMQKVSNALKLLNENEIKYETSIIYAIPGQTVISFIDTIEYLLLGGCKKIKSFPLHIASNSKMKQKIKEYQVSEKKDEYNVTTVVSSFTFPAEQRKDMDMISKRLEVGEIKLITEKNSSDYHPPDSWTIKEAGQYQWEILKIDESGNYPEIYSQIMQFYIKSTLADMREEDFRQSQWASIMLKPNRIADKVKFINDYISGEKMLQLKLSDFPPIQNSDETLSSLFKLINQSLLERKYQCKLHIGKSGNIYVFREIVSEKFSS